MTKYEEIMDKLRKYYKEDNKDAYSKLLNDWRIKALEDGSETMEEFKGFFDRKSSYWKELLFMSNNFANRQSDPKRYPTLPNLENWQARHELETGQGVKFSTVENLMKDLNSDSQ